MLAQDRADGLLDGCDLWSGELATHGATSGVIHRPRFHRLNHRTLAAAMRRLVRANESRQSTGLDLLYLRVSLRVVHVLPRGGLVEFIDAPGVELEVRRNTVRHNSSVLSWVSPIS